MTNLSIRESHIGAEIRQRAFNGAEIRSLDDGTGGENLRFTGYASVTESPYEMRDFLGDYTEVVRQGAFARTLANNPDVPFKVNHAGLTLARTKSGTLRLAEDSTGLHVEADLDPRSPDVQSLRSAMERGDIDEMSFGFRIDSAQWSPDFSQLDITDVDLNKGDVSAVNYGANPATAGASLRSRDVITRAMAEADPEMREQLAEFMRRISGDDPTPVSSNLSHYALRLHALGI